MSVSVANTFIGNDDKDQTEKNKLEIQRDLGNLLDFEDAIGDSGYSNNQNDSFMLGTGHHNNKDDFNELSTGRDKRGDFYNNKDDYYEMKTGNLVKDKMDSYYMTTGNKVKDKNDFYHLSTATPAIPDLLFRKNSKYDSFDMSTGTPED